ncbi:centrosomal protein of 192 kDa isoform X3 [Amblyraja radiata]|uniref:centrosomal protein of 192 kDa isoform X3 n=1 Tax=Amblyraja radiata TaxID=386614 RepID=UPI001401BDB9|nr:centrosomal protein of 192 kDa isoform X3 [Amblyraja radiata]
MESVRNLEDETFPSFLLQSVRSDGSEMLENVTVTSNFGLPVAASTVAKKYDMGSRIPDTQTSYLEEGRLSVMEAHQRRVSNSETCKRFVLSFKDDLETFDDFIGARMDELDSSASEGNAQHGLSSQFHHSRSAKSRIAIESLDEISSGSNTLTDQTSKKKNEVATMRKSVNCPASRRTGVALGTERRSGSLASLLEDEKLLSLASLEELSTDDEFDADVFRDDRLEAYFKKLVPLGMQRGHIEGQELPEVHSTVQEINQHELDSYLGKLGKAPLQPLDCDEDGFQMPPVRQAATGMDSAPSSGEDTEDELDAIQKQSTLPREALSHAAREMLGESNQPSFRPGLEGGSSDESIGPLDELNEVGLEFRRSVEGRVINSPIVGDGGDGSSGNEDDGIGVSTRPSATSSRWRREIADRNITGGDDHDSTANLSSNNAISDHFQDLRIVDRNVAGQDQMLGTLPLQGNRECIPGQNEDTLDTGLNDDMKLDSVYFRSGGGNNTATNQTLSMPLRLSQITCSPSGDNSLGLRDGPCGIATAEQTYAMENSDVADQSSNAGAGPPLAAVYLSPAYQDESDLWQNSSKNILFYDKQEAECSIDDSTMNNKEAKSGVVYQNEEGCWVTDLAYYYSLDQEQDQFHLPTDLSHNKAAALIEEDQEEFEEDHKFIQEDKMEVICADESLRNDSWKMPSSLKFAGSSTTPDVVREDQNYPQLTPGDFFGERSEALGCLGEQNSKIKRPSFGYAIISPKRRTPVALIRPSDLSEIQEEGKQLLKDDTLCSDDLDQTLCGTSAEFSTAFLVDKQTEDHRFNKEPSSNIQTKESMNTGLSANLKVEETKLNTDSILSISTIASAIADASVSADPAQLASMILELSNKNRKKNKPQAMSGEPTHVKSQKSHVINNMAKNLEIPEATKSEIPKSELKLLSKSVSSVLSESSRNPQSMLNSFSMESISNGTSKQKNKHIMHSEEKFQKGNVEMANSLRPVEGEIRCNSQNARNETCALETQNPSYSKHNSSKLTDPNLVINKSYCDRAPVSSVGKVHEMPAMNGTTIRTAKQIKAHCSRDNESSLDKIQCKTGTQGGAGMMQLREGQSSERISASVSRSGQNITQVFATCQSSAVQDAMRSDSSLSCPSMQNVGPVEQRFRGSKIYENDRAIIKTATPHLGRDVQETPDLHGKAKKDNIVQSNCTPATPKDYKSEHVSEADQLNLRPLTSPLIHSSPTNVTELPTATSSSSSLMYSSSNLSRLSYISGIDATLQNSTAIYGPVNTKNDKIIELSTTIIRASPTATPDQTIVNTSELTSLDGCTNDYFNTNSQPRKLCNDEQQENEIRSSVGKHESRLDLNKLPSSQSENVKIQQLDSSPSVSSKSITYKGSPAQHKTDNVGAPSQSKMNELHCMESLDAASTNTNGLGDKWMPILSFQPHGAVSDIPAVPTLLTANSLLTTPLAQQYLSNLTTSTNCLNVPLTSCYLGNTLSSNIYRLPGGLPAANLFMGNVQAFGTQLDPKLGMRIQDPAQFYNAHSIPQEPNFQMQSVGYQPSRIGMLDHWSGGPHMSDVGCILLPEELRFPNSCCVGIASQTSLSMFNPTERWMQVSIGVVSVALNGEKMDTFAHQCWIFKNKTIIGPHVTEDLKLMFLPRHPGVFQCVLSVSSHSVSADANTFARAEALAVRVIVTAVAEDPLVEILAEKNGCLDFGDFVPGGGRTLTFKLVNETRATIPIRLVISANAAAWRCFTFSKSDTVTDKALQTERLSQFDGPLLLNHVLQASYDGEDPESLVVWVRFQAPQKYIHNTDPLGAAEDYLGRINVEVDTPGPRNVINSIHLCSRVGVVRIHAPKNQQTLVMSAEAGVTAKQILLLKNAGNINAELNIQAADSSCFLVQPENIHIRPGEESEVVVSHTPKDTQSEIQSQLVILVQPFGPQYEVGLKGLLWKPELDQSISSSSSSSVEIPPILSNKQFMAWGGVSLGRTVHQKLILRNSSSTITQQLRLLIKGQDQDCFQLQSTFGPEERLTNNRELMVCPEEDVRVHLLFAPTRVACMLASLEIKQLGIHSTRSGVKFRIPLSGYGGTSNIILEDVKKTSGSYVLNLNDIAPDKVSKISFYMRNTGSRAAYVKAACFKDLQIKNIMTTEDIKVSPAQFVLKERTRQAITVTYHATPRECFQSETDSALLSIICFFCGDEVARQQLRRALAHNRQALEQIMRGDNPLQKIDFTQTFSGEELVSEVYDIPNGPKDVHIFYGNQKKVMLSVTARSAFRELPNTEDLDSFSQGMNVASESALGNSERNPSNASLDVLPVRGPQGSPLLLHNSNQVQSQSPKPKYSWTVRPEHLILTVASTDGSVPTGRVQIRNHSTRSLSFELTWPAHTLTVTPQHGVVDPESHLLILVSPNPSLVAKPSAVPWSGKIYVQCDNQQQLIKVQIREDVTMDASVAVQSPNVIPDTEPWTPNLHHSIIPSNSPPAILKIKSRTAHFPSTEAGSSSESLLEIENAGGETIQWFLSSFAPPYVKWVDDSGDVYRATYSAFRWSRVSGTLQGHTNEELPVYFMPRDKGDYAQFWDLEYRLVAEPHMKDKVQFQLHGVGTKAKVSSKETDSATELVKTEVAVKPRKSERITKTGREFPNKGVYAPEDSYSFPAIPVWQSGTIKVHLRNSSCVAHSLQFVNPREPFYIKHSNYSLRAQHYINLPVQFKPECEGRFEALLVVQTDTCGSIPIRLVGEAIAKVFTK